MNPFDEADEKTLNQKEFKLQTHIVEKHGQYFPHILMSHIPNRPSSAKDGFFKKKMGVRSGVSDIALWWIPAWIENARELHYGLRPMQAGMVELKVDAKIRSDQNKWLSAFDACGGYQGVARSWEQYYKLLCSWGIEPTKLCTIFEEPDYRTEQQKFANSFDFYKP